MAIKIINKLLVLTAFICCIFCFILYNLRPKKIKQPFQASVLKLGIEEGGTKNEGNSLKLIKDDKNYNSSADENYGNFFVTKDVNHNDDSRSDNYHNYSVIKNVNQNKDSSANFKVLLWTSFKAKTYKGPSPQTSDYNRCKYKNCFETFNKTEIMSSDAVLFLVTHIGGTKKLPIVRNPKQKWIIHMRESPQFQPSYAQYNGVFNATWSYDNDSDIRWNHSHTIPKWGIFEKRAPHEILNISRDYTKGRPNMVVWFVSNCKAKHRLNYARHLQEFINVDIYGHCGDMECKKENKSCLSQLAKTYKFYLVFENSLCDDYVTEKLAKAISIGVVPIVMGAFDYASFLPPGSYMDVKDFKSPKHLADHLLKVSSSKEFYNSYFAWKQTYKLIKLPLAHCNLCEYLNKARNVHKVYDRLDLFWSKKTKCYEPAVFYKNVDASAWT